MEESKHTSESQPINPTSRVSFSDIIVVDKKKSLHKHCEIIHTKDIILDDESPLAAAKRGKESSMWKAIESQKENKSDISLSAGNTGALLIISKLLLNHLKLYLFLVMLLFSLRLGSLINLPQVQN